MKNAWLDEIKINIMVDKLSICLDRTFTGTKMCMKDWVEYVSSYLKDKPQRLRDAVIWRHTFAYEVDDQDCVLILKFIKLPWLI